MSKKNVRRRVFIFSWAFICVFPKILPAQYTYSAFNDASVAYIGLSGLGMNFALANPAILGALPYQQRFIYTLEATHDNIETAFEDALPDFTVQFAITPRLRIALAQLERVLPTQATAYRSGSELFLGHPLRFMVFEYKQDWSAGLGLQLKHNLSVGIAMRHENYAVLPPSVSTFPFSQSFRTFDLGLRRSAQRLNVGLVFRNLISDRTTEPYTQPIQFINPNDPTQSFNWHPTQFTGIAFKPQFYLEGGVHWMAASHWQFLGDVSSRKEYALGLRWRVVSKFSFTTGTRKRFDRLYTHRPITYTTLGGQFQHDKFALGLTWIIPLSSHTDQIVSMPYGTYTLIQMTYHRLLIAGAFAL